MEANALESLASLMMNEDDDESANIEGVENYIKHLRDEILPEHHVESSVQVIQDSNANEELLYSLILNCAQAIDDKSDSKAYNLALQIRQKSNRTGVLHERVAYYFGEALIARILGIGSLLYSSLSEKHDPQQYFKHIKIFAEKTPNVGVPILFINQNILAAAAGERSIHVIDYGISHGYQWMCLIKELSQLPGGPPKFKLSGIEHPPDYHRHVAMQEVGEHLAKYAHELGVPFEFHPLIEERWESLTLASFSMSEEDLLIVTCCCRLRNVPKFARQKLLLSIHKMNPKIFILATYNAACNSRNLVSKIHGALKIYTGLFASGSSINEEQRFFVENYAHDLDILSLIACKDRFDGDGPESYKRWELRFEHAGFEQLPVAPHILNNVLHMMQGYDREFHALHHRNWLLIGWKDHILNAFAIWQPTDL